MTPNRPFSPAWAVAPAATRRWAVLPLCWALSACGLLPTQPSAGLPPPTPLAAAAPVAWQAPLPHEGQASALQQWWQQFNDPLLLRLIDAAQAASPGVASATARIAQARAGQVAAGATGTPQLNASANAVRGKQDVINPVATSYSSGLQASWELDLWGGVKAGRDAASERLAGSQAAWHDARVSVAAEVAGNYTQLRACQAQVQQTTADVASRAETARLADLLASKGFQAPADAALARAGAAQSRSALTQQQAQCDALVKALVALTALDEPALRADLAAGAARLPRPAELVVGRVPAQALAQRPDVFMAERDWLAARGDLRQQQATRWPRVSLNGSLTAGRVETAAYSGNGTLWSLGPLSVTLPILDGGQRAANTAAAEARVVEAEALYRARLRNAVREVEDALLTLRAGVSRQVDAELSAQGFDAALRGTEARQRSGLASLFELESARRDALQSRSALIELQRERVATWIALYRALGGGWAPDDGVAEAAAAAPAPASAPASGPTERIPTRPTRDRAR